MRVKLQLVVCHDDGYEEPLPISSPKTAETMAKPLTQVEK